MTFAFCLKLYSAKAVFFLPEEPKEREIQGHRGMKTVIIDVFLGTVAVSEKSLTVRSCLCQLVSHVLVLAGPATRSPRGLFDLKYCNFAVWLPFGTPSISHRATLFLCLHILRRVLKLPVPAASALIVSEIGG